VVVAAGLACLGNARLNAAQRERETEREIYICAPAVFFRVRAADLRVIICRANKNERRRLVLSIFPRNRKRDARCRRRRAATTTSLRESRGNTGLKGHAVAHSGLTRDRGSVRAAIPRAE